MRPLGIRLAVLLAVGAMQVEAVAAEKESTDAAEIRALEQRFVAAFKAKDINAIMSVYVPDESLVVFDVVPPRQYVGAKAYRKDYDDVFASFSGPVETFDISELSIMTDGDLGVSHSVQRAVLTDKEGKKVDMTFRVTDVYRKIKGKWLIVHEHVSAPVDLATGKADFSGKP
jgi:uncharacterized protein (TIGR02246 family)